MKKFFISFVVATIAITSTFDYAGATKQKQQKQKEAEFSWGLGNSLIVQVSQHIGKRAHQLGLPSRLWCADFMNKFFGGKSRAAITYAYRGKKAKYGCVHCVAVTKRRGGHHVGIVKGYDRKGNPILISGNHGRKVAVAAYKKHKVIAYRYIKPKAKHS